MNGRIKDKIDEISDYLNFLMESKPNTFENYQKSRGVRAICEHYYEKIIEASVDLAFIFIKECLRNESENIKPLESDLDAFGFLAEQSIISRSLADRLIEAKGMRNIIAHEYGRVDDKIVFHALSEELEKDINEFLNSINKAMDEEIGK